MSPALVRHTTLLIAPRLHAALERPNRQSSTIRNHDFGLIGELVRPQCDMNPNRWNSGSLGEGSPDVGADGFPLWLPVSVAAAMASTYVACDERHTSPSPRSRPPGGRGRCVRMHRVADGSGHVFPRPAGCPPRAIPAFFHASTRRIAVAPSTPKSERHSAEPSALPWQLPPGASPRPGGGTAVLSWTQGETYRCGIT